jgi:hypothetical protein
MSLDPSTSRDSVPLPAPEGRRLVLPLGFVAIGILGGYLASDGTWLGRDWAGPLLNPWLSGLFGPEGVHPAREFLVKLCFVPLAVGFLWLAGLYRQPVEPEVRRAVEQLRSQAGTAALLLLSVFATIAAVVACFEESPARGGWLYEHLGPQAPHLVEIAFFGGLTLLAGRSLARQVRRNRALRSLASDPEASQPR